MQCTASKWSMYFQLLISIMNINFDTQPASFMQQFNAWKEQVVRYEQLSGDQLPDLVKCTAVVNGLKGSVRNFVLLNLGDSSFGDLHSLLVRYMRDQHEPSLESSCDRACKDRSDMRKRNDKESNPNFEQQLEEGGTKERKEKGRQAKRKGAAYHPQPPACKGKWEHAQLPKEQWCSLCRKKGHNTQACWWNSNQQHQQQHQQHQACFQPSNPRTSSTIEASRRGTNLIFTT